MNTMIILVVVLVVLVLTSVIGSYIQKKRRDEELNMSTSTRSIERDESKEEDDDNDDTGTVESKSSGFGCLFLTVILIGLMCWGGYHLFFEEEPIVINKTFSVERVEKPKYVEDESYRRSDFDVVSGHIECNDSSVVTTVIRKTKDGRETYDTIRTTSSRSLRTVNNW